MIRVELADKGITVDFPDGMSEQEISAVIQEQFYGGGAPAESEQPTPTPTPEAVPEEQPSRNPFVKTAHAATLRPDLLAPTPRSIAEGKMQRIAAEKRAVGEDPAAIKQDFQAGNLVEPWIDPITVGAGAGGTAAKLSLAAGRGIATSLARGAVAAVPAAAMEYPIGVATEVIGEKHPEIAFLFNVATGFASGLTIERLAEKGMLKTLGRIIKRNPEKAAEVLPSKVMDAWKQTGGFSEWSPEISARMKKKMARGAEKAATKEVTTAKQPDLPATRQDLEDLMGPEIMSEMTAPVAPGTIDLVGGQMVVTKEPPPKVKPAAKRQAGFSRIHGAIARTGAGAGIGAVVPDEESKRGSLRNILAGAALGVAAPRIAKEAAWASKSAAKGAPKAVPNTFRAWRQGMKLRDAYDTHFGKPIVDAIKTRINGEIVNEDVRHGLGLGRSQEFKETMRKFKRDTDRIWQKAAELGEELVRLAPTRVEQRRLMQVLRGSVTANAEMAAKAKQVQKLFSELQDQLKKHDLLRYSRFDKLTQKERAKLIKTLQRTPDPYSFKSVHDYNSLAYIARKDLGMDPEKIRFGYHSKVGKFEHGQKVKVNRQQDFEVLQAAIQERLDLMRSRLKDYYHYASAQEYAPVFYQKHEGLSPNQKQLLTEEINKLKVMSRRGNPEGKQELEDMISELEMMVNKGAEGKRAYRMKRHALVKGYAHRRLDMPIEVQRILGLIEEAPFPAAKGVGIQATDVRKAKLFEEIASNPAWAFRATKDIEAPKNYRLIEDDAFGALKGMYVRKDVWDDLREVNEWRTAGGQLYDKWLGHWKSGKVIWNPATHARNFYSNMLLAYLGDVSPTDTKTYNKAFKSFRNKDTWYKEAEEWGLFNDTFYSSEINKLRDGLEAVRDPKSMKAWTQKAFSLPAEAYQGQEKFFKMAVYIKAREGGASIDEAAKKAEKFLFNYADIPPWVKFMKRWVSPFFTFTYKAVPLFAEMSIRKPWKVGAIMGAMYGLEEASKAALGISDEEAKTQRKLLPEWQRSKAPPLIGPYAHVRMPIPDKWGNQLLWDTSFILPYGNVAEKWGQSILPNLLMPNSPWFQVLTAVAANREPFSGKDIKNSVLDSWTDVVDKYIEYAWREAMPSLAPGGYGWNKLKTGFQNMFRDEPVLDWADRPMQLSTAILSTLLGIKLSPVNEKKLWQFEKGARNKIGREVSKEKGKLRGQFRRNEIDKDEFQKQVRELNRLKRKLLMERPKK